MVEISAIRGITYDPARVDPSRVLAPPYDVIDEDERQELERLDAHNAVRLILPRGTDAEKYQAAARTLAAWQKDGTLRRDATPALYRYHQVFANSEADGQLVVRRGFIAGVRLQTFDQGGIRPHERTLRGPKIDRLSLMRATGAHFSQIFTLYADKERITDGIFEPRESGPPALEGKTTDGTLHRLWRVTDAPTIAKITRVLRERDLYIADGHHRYETMLAWRDELRQAQGAGRSPNATSELGTLFLANMDDPGLLVFPIHRIVSSLPDFDFARLCVRAREHFDVEEVAGGASDAARLRALLAERGRARTVFAAALPHSTAVTLFALKGSARDAGLVAHPSLLELDVTVLHGLIFERLLGIDGAALEAQTNIEYVKDTKKALAKISAGQGQLAFFLNPTRVHQVKAVADAGQVMPQKSTYFFPKIASGLVIHPIVPGETFQVFG